MQNEALRVWSCVLRVVAQSACPRGSGLRHQDSAHQWGSRGSCGNLREGNSCLPVVMPIQGNRVLMPACILFTHLSGSRPCPGAAHSLTARGQISHEPWPLGQVGSSARGGGPRAAGEGGVASTHPQLFLSAAPELQPASLPSPLCSIPFALVLPKAGSREGLSHLSDEPQ